jgi:hypothetical protein
MFLSVYFQALSSFRIVQLHNIIVLFQLSLDQDEDWPI